MRKKNLLFPTLLLSLTPSLVQAKLNGSIILEPLVGLQFGKWANERKGTKNTQAPYELEMFGDQKPSYHYGVKLLYLMKKSMIGLQAHRQSVTWTYNKVSGEDTDDDWRDEVDADIMTISAIVGMLSKSKKFSFWIGADLLETAELSANINPDELAPTYTGRGLRIGFSFARGKGKSFRYNFEYHRASYSGLKQGQTDGSIPGVRGNETIVSAKREEYLFSISFPFTIKK